MSIGTTIKKLRIARKLTQEELASHLGITSKAVSQWECNRTSPDISQIPALCNFFQISADQLLKINLPQNEEEKQNILHRYYELFRKGYLKEAWELLQEGVSKFPNDFSIMMHLSICGNRLCDFLKLTPKEIDLIRRQCAEYCKRILDGCTDDFIRNVAISNLCAYYAEKGEHQKAEELAGKMPIMIMSQEFIFANIYTGSKANEANQRLKSILLQFLIKRLDSDKNLYSSEEINILREKKIALVELLFENGDFGFYSGGLSDFYEESARYYASIKNSERALEYLEKATCSAIYFIMLMQKETFTHTSLFLKGMVEKSQNVSLNGGANQAAVILKNMEQEEYDIIRKTDKFQSLSEELKRYIKINL